MSEIENDGPDASKAAERPTARRAAKGVFDGAGRLLRPALLVGLVLGFWVALSAIEDLVRERVWMRDAAAQAVSALWSPAQTVAGPFVTLPEERLAERDRAVTLERQSRIVAPQSVEVRVELRTETRHRGLFDIPVYTADITWSGRFNPAALTGDPNLRIAGLAPYLVIAVADAVGITGTPSLTWNGTPLSLEPRLPEHFRETWPAGAIGAPLPDLLGDVSEDDGRFTLSLSLRGTEAIRIAPSGLDSAVAVDADWPHPSFVGNRATASHEIGADGFQARWSFGPFGRAIQQSWVVGDEQADPVARVRGDAVGVALHQQVEPYRMTERSLKYGMLFVLYTIGAFLLLELLFRRRLHVAHYLLSGASVSVFFLLLLSLAEIVGFAAAYALGAAAVVAQTGLYAGSILDDRRLAIGFAALLGLLYAGLFTLLRLEDTALVTGSIALFVAIGVAMALTRRLIPTREAEVPATS